MASRWVVGACLTVGCALIAARAPYEGNRNPTKNVTSKNMSYKRKILINFLNQPNVQFNFYMEWLENYYNAQDGNYYAIPRQEVSPPFERPTSFLQLVVDGT